MIATLFALMLAGNAGCTWSEHAGFYGPGYPKEQEVINGVGTTYSLAEAQKRCLAAAGCKAVTCQKKESECTLRASSQLQKTAACNAANNQYACNEVSYVPQCSAPAPAPAPVCWSEHAGFYGPGYPKEQEVVNGVGTTYSLAEAQKRCLAAPGCKAVTCQKKTSECTLRASNDLKKSAVCNNNNIKWACNEISYVQAKCAAPAPAPAPKPACVVSWSEHAGLYGPGYPKEQEVINGVGTTYSLAEAQKRCLASAGCKSVTCQKKDSECTLRASSQLKKSAECNAANNQYACNEVSYVPTKKCGKAPTPAPTANPTPNPTPAPTNCQATWTTHPGYYGPGYAKGYVNPMGGYSLAEAQKRCLAFAGCKAVTCEQKTTRCTLRASSQLGRTAVCNNNNNKWACNEVSYVPTKCVN